MNKTAIEITASFDYENDTVVRYWEDDEGSHMTASFTSEDPDYGTDTLEYNAYEAEPLITMAKSWLEELAEYLNKTHDGRFRPGDAPDELELVFGDYSNSTLFAIESILLNITKEEA